MFKDNKNIRTTYFTPFSSVSNVDFEQVHVSWDDSLMVSGEIVGNSLQLILEAKFGDDPKAYASLQQHLEQIINLYFDLRL